MLNVLLTNETWLHVTPSVPSSVEAARLNECCGFGPYKSKVCENLTIFRLNRGTFSAMSPTNIPHKRPAVKSALCTHHD